MNRAVNCGIAALSVAMLGMAAGCSANATPPPKATTAQASVSAVQGEAQLPTIIGSADMLLDIEKGGGTYRLPIQPVTDGNVTLQVACVGGDSMINIQIVSNSPGNTLLWSVNQGCAPGTQKVVFNPGAQPDGMQMKVVVPSKDYIEVLLGK